MRAQCAVAQLIEAQSPVNKLKRVFNFCKGKMENCVCKKRGILYKKVMGYLINAPAAVDNVLTPG